MDKEKLNWRSFADPGAINAKWNAGSPTYYIIDARGVIRYKWNGGPGEKTIDAALEKVIQKAAQDKGRDKSATPADRHKALVKDFYETTHVFSFKAKTDADRNKAVARVAALSLRCLELAEKNPKDPVALDALVQVVNQEIWLENNTAYPGRGKDSPQSKAIAILLRDHLKSDKLGYACWRVGYGFHKDCETFLRTVLDKNPHRDVRAQACIRLAQFLNARSHRLDLLKGRPEMARRYQGLFGKDYMEALQRQDRAKTSKEVEALFERAVAKYGDAKLPYGEAVGVRAKAELFEIRHLTVGKQADEIEGQDQDGKRFKLSDYRGKVVLLYFWSEY
jgi:hypothetical protein